MTDAKPLVAIVGRPNVGKSTLFNRLVGRRVAIVEDTPGVTRDRIYGDVEYSGRVFTVVDTGGMGLGEESELGETIHRQAEMAVEEADAILFLVDALSGVTSLDVELANTLRGTRKPVLLVVNKTEGKMGQAAALEFYSLGLGEPIAISAEHGLGIDDLLDELLATLPPGTYDEHDEEVEGPVKVAVVGRPNAGKSSLINALVGMERVIVSDRPGTTRDAVDVLWTRGEDQILFIDTAGLRKKGKIKEAVERYGVFRALRAISRADVALLMVDAEHGVKEQERRIAAYVKEAGAALCVVVNKWDLIEREYKDQEWWREAIARELYFYDQAPVVFISALYRRNLGGVVEVIREVYAQHTVKVSTAQLNRVIEEAVDLYAPPQRRGGRLKLFYATQVDTGPPTFLIFVNNPRYLHENYQRYLEKQIRQGLGLDKVAVRLRFRPR